MPDNLLKLLIVDDEFHVRNILKNSIDWTEIGYEIVGEASCAQEALQLVDENVPDVIFTDICMPFIDGIELSEMIFEKDPTIKIVVLTGFDEFEYAQRSIKVGIADFLLKPINDSEIIKVALDIKRKIEAERNHQNEHERLKKHVEENLPFLRERTLNELIQTHGYNESIANRLKFFNLDLQNHLAQIAVIDLYPAEDNEQNEEDRLYLKIMGVETVQQYFRNDSSVFVFLDLKQRIIVLNNEETVELAVCMDAIKAMLINRLKCFATIGIGNRYNTLSRLNLSYREACNALDYHIVAGKNQVIKYSDINMSEVERAAIQNEQIDALNFFLKTGLKQKAGQLLDDIFNEYSSCHINLASIRAMASTVVATALNVISEHDINISDILGKNTQPFDKIFLLDTLPEIKSYLENMLFATAEIIQNAQNKKVNQVVNRIKEYMQENIADYDLSLAKTAKEFYLNMSYLSRVFKQETGQTFIEYLTMLRMELAIKLLRETDKKAYQVSESVGIIDPHYFGTCFKKYTGVSVNDFKKNK